MRSLVQSCAESCEERWRRTDAVMERLGEAVGVGPLRRYRPRGGRQSTPEWKLMRIRELLDQGMAMKPIARELGVGKETVARVKREREKSHASAA